MAAVRDWLDGAGRRPGASARASRAIRAIGQGQASAASVRGLDPKHAIKQVDRLLRSRAIDVPALQGPWVRILVAERTAFIVTFDWTEFDADDQSTIAQPAVSFAAAKRRRAIHARTSGAPYYPALIV